MKKYVALMILLMGGWQGLFGQASPAIGSFTSAAVAPGAGISLLNTGVLFHRLTWQTSGTVSTCTVALDTSSDGITYTPGGAIAGQTCTANGNSAVVNVNANFVRINVTTISGGGTIIVTYNGWVLPPGPVAKVDALVQSANIGATALYAVPASGAGLYRVNCYAEVTLAAATSSTLPNIQIVFTTNDSNVSITANCSPGLTTNTAGANTAQVASATVSGLNINVRPSTTINYQAVSYASVPASAMQYAAHIKLEFLGN